MTDAPQGGRSRGFTRTVSPRPLLIDRSRASRSSWWTVALAGLMLHPYATVHLLDRTDGGLALAGHLCTLLADLLLLCAALILALDARLVGSALRASMATAAATVATQDLPVVTVAVIDRSFGAHTHRLGVEHVVLSIVILAVIAAGRRGTLPPRVSPLLLGLVLGSLVMGLVSGLRRMTGGDLLLRVDRPADLAAMVVLVASLGTIYLLLHRSDLPPRAVERIGLGVLAVFMARLGSTLADATAPLPLAIAGVVAFSALTVTAATALLHHSLFETTTQSLAYAERAAQAEATVRHDREVAHEVRAATAGIVAGVHLLTHGQVPPEQRSTLQHMVDVEAARLGRSLTPAASAPDRLAVDEVVGPLVVAQRALGHAVGWRPTGLGVVARRDDLAEMVNVLLNNAFRHGLGRGSQAVAEEVDGVVRIAVSDLGPGIDPKVRERLFSWGGHGPRSPGDGIGLQRARRLAVEYGGRLELEDRADGHTTFVITLPATQVEGSRPMPLALPDVPAAPSPDLSRGLAG